MNQSSSGVLFLLSVSVGVAMIGLGIIWPIIPVYAVELGAGGFLVGLIIASFNIARTFFNPLVGRLSDKIGRKQFIALMGITDAAWSLGMIVSPILSGIILDLFGLAHVFIIGSCLILFGSVVVTYFFREYQLDQAD